MVRKRGKSTSRSSPEEMLKKMVTAGRESFMHFGVARTTMSDISRALGISRQALYEYVSSRDELVEAVLKERIKEIGDDLRPLSVKSFADSFVKTSLAAIRMARNDKELMSLVASAPKDLVQKVIVGRCPDIHEIVRRLFEPILNHGLKSGRVRTDKSIDEIVDWLRLVFLGLISQTDIDPEDEYNLIAGFLLPSMMVPMDDGDRAVGPRRRKK